MNKAILHFRDFILANSSLKMKDLKLLVDHIEVHSVEKKEVVLQASDYCKHLYFIHTGLLRIFKNDDGNDVTLSFLKETDFFLDFESTLKNAPCSFSVMSIEATEYLTIPYDKLMAAYEKSHRLENFGRLMVERAFMDYINMTDLSRHPQPIERYESLEREKNDLINRIPQKVLASFIGIAPESLSRIRKRRVS